MDGRGRRPRAELSRQAAREAARRRKARRDRAIATVSTIVVLGLLATAILTSKGWPRGPRRSRVDSFKESFPKVLKGFWLDVRTSAAPAFAPLRLLSVVWVDVLRGVSLFPHLSVLENVVLAPVRAHTAARAEAESRAQELLARFGLAGHEHRRPDELSGGQQQRVAIVRALATSPRALLLDEVTSALDPELVGEVLELIRELKADGMTMIIATHEMAFARDVADEVCFLHEGMILERGDPAQVLGAPREPETQRFLRRLHAAF